MKQPASPLGAGCAVACEPLLIALYPCRHSTYCGPDIATQPARLNGVWLKEHPLGQVGQGQAKVLETGLGKPSATGRTDQ